MNVQYLKSVLWVDNLVDITDLPCLVISGGEEVTTPYHNDYYLVELSVDLRFYAKTQGTTKEIDLFFDMASDCDVLLKDVANRIPSIMAVTERSTLDVSDFDNLETPIVGATKNYIFKYKRTRGLT
jgi:hypothetical protein